MFGKHHSAFLGFFKAIIRQLDIRKNAIKKFLRNAIS